MIEICFVVVNCAFLSRLVGASGTLAAITLKVADSVLVPT